jgi:hypothetical protein
MDRKKRDAARIMLRGRQKGRGGTWIDAQNRVREFGENCCPSEHEDLPLTFTRVSGILRQRDVGSILGTEVFTAVKV